MNDLCFEQLLELRKKISDNLNEIVSLLKTNFPEYYPDAYQHWVAQIKTALYNDTRWLPRGIKTFQDTIDSIQDNHNGSGGVSKFTK